MGESDFSGPQRGRMSDVQGVLGKRAMGLEPFLEKEGMSEGELRTVREANKLFGF
jgi:hypothetical protein